MRILRLSKNVEGKYDTFLDVPSTFLMTAVNSERTSTVTSKAVPTN